MKMRSMPPISAHLAESPVPAPPPTMGMPVATCARRRARMSVRACMAGETVGVTGEGRDRQDMNERLLGPLFAGRRLPLLARGLLRFGLPRHLGFRLRQQFVEQFLRLVRLPFRGLGKGLLLSANAPKRQFAQRDEQEP